MMSDSRKAEHLPAAMRSPSDAAIPRRFPSIRRTTHIDMHVRDRGLELDGAARDLVTDATSHQVVAAARVRALLDDHGALAELEYEPHDRDGTALIGLPVAGGFRRAVAQTFPDDVATGSPLALLLDDLPVAALISGYARLYSGDVPADATRTATQTDICSGWRSNGTMMTSVRAGDGVPVTLGPSAPPVDADVEADPRGWHPMPPLPEGSMRRRRLLDITPVGDTWEVRAMFRDTHVQPGSDETVLHEYTLEAAVDAASRTFRSCAAVPRVLPWVECPVAAASADRLVGRHVETVREFVRRELRGTSTCTHLNDLLRSLGDTDALVGTLIASRPARPGDQTRSR